MDVWVVVYSYWEEELETEIIGVFDSEEKALAEKGKSYKKSIEKWEVK